MLAVVTVAGCAGSGGGSDDNPAVPPASNSAVPSGTSDTPTPPPSSTPPSPTAEPHTVVYRVTGKGEAASIVYLADGKSAEVTEKRVALPWTKTIVLPAGGGPHEVSLVVDFSEIGGVTHRQSITVDGRILTQGAVSGTGTGRSELSGGFPG